MDTLIVERDASQDEVNRWKNRVTNLIEQSNKTDPEEHKRLLQAKENLRKQLAQVRSELTRVGNQCTSLQLALTNLRQENVKSSQELTAVKKELDMKTKDCEQKQLTINRLKQIGRKYKEQADKSNKELEYMKARAAGQESNKDNVGSLESSITELRQAITISTLEAQNEAQAATKRAKQTSADNSVLKEALDKKEESITELRQTITTSSARISTLEAQLTEAQNEAQAATKRAEQTSTENSVLKEALDKKEKELNQSRSTVTQLKTEVDVLNKKTAEFDRKTAEFDKKAAQSRQILQRARTKFIELQQKKLQQLETEMTELRARGDLTAGTTASQDEGVLRAQISQLQRDLEQARREPDDVKKETGYDLQSQLDQLRSENLELLAKVHQVQRQLEHKHSPSQQASGQELTAVKKELDMKTKGL